MNDAIDPLEYTTADIAKIVAKEAKLNKWEVDIFELNAINNSLDNLDFMVDTYELLSNVVINLMQNMWQDFEHRGIYRALNITVNSKRILGTIRDELIGIDIDCYIFGDITNDCNGYVFMRVQFDRDEPAHLEKLKKLNIIQDIENINFDIIEFNLFNEDWNRQNW